MIKLIEMFVCLYELKHKTNKSIVIFYAEMQKKNCENVWYNRPHWVEYKY